MMKTATKSVLILLGLGIIGYIIEFVFNALLARYLSHTLYGDFSVAIKVLQIVGGLLLLGTDASANKFMSTYINDNDTEQLQSYFSWNFSLVFKTSILCIVFFIIAYSTIGFLHISDIVLLQELHFVVQLLWLAPVLALTLLLSSYLLCNRNHNLSYMFTYFGRYILMLVYIIVSLVLFDIVLDSSKLVVMVSLSLFVLILVEVFCIRTYFSRSLLANFKNIKLRQSNKEDAKEWLSVASRLIFNNIIYLLLSAADLIILEVLSPSETDVAYYAAALVVVSIFLVVPKSIYKAIKPTITIAIREKHFEKLQYKLNRCNAVGLLCSVSLLLAVNIFSTNLLGFFGEKYITGAQQPLLILSLGYFMATLSKPCSLLLAFTGHERKLINLSIIELILLCALGIVLFYMYGPNGIATATAIAMSYRTLAAYRHVRKLFPLQPCLPF